MAMNRSQMLSVLNNMSDDALTKAMSAVGVPSGQEEEGMDLGEEEAEGLQDWNSREVKVEASERPPIVDKSKFTAEPKQRPNYLGKGPEEDMGDLTQYMPQEGMPEQ